MKRIGIMRASISAGGDREHILEEAMKNFGVSRRTAIEYYKVALMG